MTALLTFLGCILIYLLLGTLTFILRNWLGVNSRSVFENILMLIAWPLALFSMFREPPGSENPQKALMFVPRCTSRIVFPAITPSGLPLSGIFTFAAADVENSLPPDSGCESRRRLDTSFAPTSFDYTPVLRRWLKNHSTDETPSKVPKLLLSSFVRPVSSLVRDGKALIYCRACEKLIKSESLLLTEHRKRYISESHEYRCPAQHVIYESDRPYIPKKADSSPQS